MVGKNQIEVEELMGFPEEILGARWRLLMGLSKPVIDEESGKVLNGVWSPFIFHRNAQKWM